MLVLTLLLSAVVTQTSGFLFEDTRCHEGPAYWCSSLETAKICQAEQYCKQNIWEMDEEEKAAVGNYVTCKACTWAFYYIEDYVFTESNEMKVVNFTQKLCNHVPADYTDMCKKFISEHGKQALDVLKLKLGPEVVCRALGQCTASATILSAPLPKETTCNTCKSTMQSFKHDNEKVVAWWQHACKDKPQEDMVECVKYSEYFAQMNAVILNDQICEIMEMC